MKPWDNDFEDKEDGKSYLGCTADEFYVALSNAFYDPDDTSMIVVAITPVEFYETNKYMYDQSMQIEHLLPDDFRESCEGLWECPRDWETVRADLLQRGFKESPEFSDLSMDN